MIDMSYKFKVGDKVCTKPSRYSKPSMKKCGVVSQNLTEAGRKRCYVMVRSTRYAFDEGELDLAEWSENG